MIMDSFEYVITDGPGSMIDHGVVDAFGVSDLMREIWVHGGDLLISPCDDECETGE